MRRRQMPVEAVTRGMVVWAHGFGWSVRRIEVEADRLILYCSAGSKECLPVGYEEMRLPFLRGALVSVVE